jgi:quinol-cytochrome oxidoreductase complex cytochrome b subunit
VLVAFVLFLSVFFNAPLEAPANPGLSPNPTKAPWYFAGFQELLLHIHPTFAVCVVPFLLALALCAVPYLRYQEDSSGIWFISQKARRVTIFSSITSCVITVLLIIFHDATSKGNSIAQSMPSIVGTGFVPVIVLLCILFGMYWFLRKKCAASNNEAVQNIFVVLIVAFVVLTVLGAWFRGKDMALTLFG